MIVYGSLYPWHFQWRVLPANPLWILLHSWRLAYSRRIFADIVVNVGIYVPLGMSGCLALRKFRIAGPVAMGMCLSAGIEMLQLFVPGRNCSALDLLTNTLGSALGVACGMIFSRIAAGRTFRLNHAEQMDRSALALLFCWVGVLLFPFFPVISPYAWKASFAHFTETPVLQPVRLFSQAACWFVAGRLLSATGLQTASRWLALSLLLLLARFFIVTRQPLPADFVGALAGLALFQAIGAKSGPARLIISVGFLAILLIGGLSPYHFAAARTFSWRPFGAFLAMDWQAGLRVLLEKLYYYGAAVWLLREAGLRLRASVLTVAVLLAAIEIAQVWLPGRTPEITDPILALLSGIGFRALNPRRKSATIHLPPVPP